jgi:hypothetical protein
MFHFRFEQENLDAQLDAVSSRCLADTTRIDARTRTVTLPKVR